MADSCYGDEKRERRTQAVKDLEEYIRDPHNPLNKYIENIKRMVQSAYDEVEQFSAQKFASFTRDNEELKTRLKKTEQDRERYRHERNQLREKIETLNKEIKERPYSKDEEQLRRENDDLRKFYEAKEKEWEQKMKDSEHSTNEIIRYQKQKLDEYKEEIKKQVEKSKQLQESIERNEFESNDIGKLRKQLEESKKQLNTTNDRLHRVSETLKRTQEELNDTKTRLSSVMGHKLTDNNPNIADLSDRDRPTKLAEKFAELYDNQWSDAFEELQKSFSSDEQIIEILLEILMDIYDFCKRRAREQLDDLQRVLVCSKSVERTQTSCPDNVIKQLKDCRKTTSSMSLRSVYEMYLSSLTTSRGNLRYAVRTKTFVQGCLEICWPMTLQDPPVVFGTMAKYGEALKTDIYKPYIQSGPYIKYVVWPSLLLHKDGPLLAKGVAQGSGGTREAWSDDKRHKVPKKPFGYLGSGLTVGHKEPNYNENKHLSHSQNKMLDRPNTANYGSLDVRDSQRQIRDYRDYSRDHEHQSLPTKTEYEDEPSASDMRLFFRYADRSEFSRARNLLGAEMYSKCWVWANERHKFI